MRVRFWGTRGSIPVALDTAALQAKLTEALLKASGKRFRDAAEARGFIERELDFAASHTFGGASPCVEVERPGAAPLILDLGSGVRGLGARDMARTGRPHAYNVIMSHMHWDHIMGFPFFTPAYVPGTRIRIHGCHDGLEHALRRQQDAPSFPVPFDRLAARIEFVVLEAGRRYDIDGIAVTGMRQAHSGDSYAYRLEHGGKALVYATDSEHKLEDPREREAFAAFFRDADMVIFDAMYSLAEAVSVKEDWGHSSNVVGVELCQLAGAKHLVLFHHEPASDDATIARIWRDTVRLEEITREGRVPLRVTAAYDGLELDV
jgi:phosphoribosyl 1,2-cyclic phosphodiesterase